MSRWIIFIAAAALILHGLIHLMGFVAYWPLAQLAERPYKTTLAGGRWVLGPSGILLWILVLRRLWHRPAADSPPDQVLFPPNA